jgi:2'-5' RNA ligase
VGVPLPDDVRQRLAAEIERLRAHAADVAWVAPDNLHVTLKFLGPVDEARVPSVAAAVTAAAAGQRGFEVGVRGLGAFPSPERPRVLWAGVDDAPQRLAALAAAVDAACGALGFPPEPRAFAAHVTLGRVRDGRRRPALAAALGRGGDFGRVRVDRAVLMRSDLSPRGARYSALADCPLAVQ